MNDTVAITVAYNTPDLIINAISSIRKFYKDLRILIVDGSPYQSPCYKAISSLCRLYKNISVIRNKINTGHGPGLHLGISYSSENNIIIFDSDIVMNEPCVDKMKAFLTDKTYGVGQVVDVNSKGQNVKNGIRYLHPHFALISRRAYYLNKPFIQHGAPLISTMISIKKTGFSVIDFPVGNYVTHLERGTRKVIDKEGLAYFPKTGR